MTELLRSLDPRELTWDLDALEPRSCPFCSRPPRGSPALRPDGIQVFACECGLKFVSPAPSEEALSAFYEKYFEHAGWTGEDDARVAELRSADPLAHYRTRRLNALMNFRGSDALDVGFGQGADLVRYQQLGARTFGVDFDKDSVRFATQALGVVAEVGGLKAFGPTQLFDLISLHDVIEHPLDPVALVEQCVARLRPGGLLSIWTPNGGFIDRDPEKVALRVDLEHMQYLAVENIAQLAERFGARTVHLEQVGWAILNQGETSAGKAGVRSVAKRVLPSRLRGLVAARQVTSWVNGQYHLFTVLQRHG